MENQRQFQNFTTCCMKNVEFRIVVFLCLFCSLHGIAQFSVVKDLTPAEIVRELVGPNIVVSNIKFNGNTVVDNPEWGIGQFAETEGRLDSLASGVVLATYNLQFLNLAPNSHTAIDDQDLVLGAHHKTTDTDYHQMIKEPNQQYFDGTVLEFDFISPGDSLSFNYIFGSDEYPFFVCSQYNDAFGLFLSGPGINGPYTNGAVNLAEITASDLIAGVNTINIGQQGTGVSPSQARNASISIPNYCGNGAGLNQGDLFVENGTSLVMNDMELNGFSHRLLAAYGPLECFKKYHLKFVIADVSDHRFNSVVFIEPGNFIANSKVTATAAIKVNNVGCDPFLLTTINKTKAKQHYWSFGDGFESNLIEPEHTYEQPGKYQITYIATDSTKCEPIDTQLFQIEILSSKIFAPKLKVALSQGCSTLDSLEVNITIGNGTDLCYWNMGDGSNDLKGLKVNHVYQKEGTYTIEAKALDTVCNRDTTLFYEVNYTGPPRLKAAVKAENYILGCESLDMQLTNSSFDSPETKHYWDFGDGESSEEFEPRYFYTKTGRYTVSYVVTNDTFCIPSDTTSFDVKVLNTELFEAKLIEPQVPPCAFEDTITLSFEIQGKAFEYITWDFGDGSVKVKGKSKVNHHYKNYGPFKASILLTDTGCGLDSLILFDVLFNEPSKTIAKIDAEEKIIGCKPFLAKFSNKSNSTKHIWDFGDGKTSNQKEPQHHYKETGTYTVTYIGINKDLCYPIDTTEIEIDVVRTKEFSAKLDFTPPEPCSSTKFTLEIRPKYTGESTDSLVWDFGDGSDKKITTGNNVYKTTTHTYKETGNYKIQLKAFDNLCNNQDEITIPINFKRKPDVRDIIVPNVFTPNNDGINEQFFMFYDKNKEHNLYTDLLEYELDIFDRNGNNIYSTKMVNQAKETAIWDGSTPTGMVDRGVYFYVMKYRVKCINEDQNKPVSIIRGSVSIMK